MISKETANKMKRKELIKKLEEMYLGNHLCVEAINEIVCKHGFVEIFNYEKAQKTEIRKLRKWVCNYTIYVSDPLMN